MSYVLEGRALGPKPPLDSDRELDSAPCIFCGRLIEHINDGGVGWCVGAVVDGRREYFLYCSDGGECSEHVADAEEFPPHGSVWRCGCSADYVENVGDRCAACGIHRIHAVPYPSHIECPECDGDLMATESGGPPWMTCECGWCGFDVGKGKLVRTLK